MAISAATVFPDPVGAPTSAELSVWYIVWKICVYNLFPAPPCRAFRAFAVPYLYGVEEVELVEGLEGLILERGRGQRAQVQQLCKDAPCSLHFTAHRPFIHVSLHLVACDV